MALFHTGEVPYAYDNLKFVNRPWEDVDHELARIMSSYFANFIKTGNPNGDNLPLWDAYNTSAKKNYDIGCKVTNGNNT
jgi:para-nitrobenzyl esterase